MWRLHHWFLIAILAGICVIFTSLSAQAQPARRAMQCDVIRTAGDVWLYPDAGDEYHQAESGEKMMPGDMLRVGEDSKALLRFAGGTLLLLKENSDFYLREAGAEGGASFEVEVPNALAVVRGTVFGADISAQGEVEFRGFGGEVEITFRDRKLRLKPFQVYRLARERAILAHHRKELKEALKEFDFKARPPKLVLQKLKNAQKARPGRARRPKR